MLVPVDDQWLAGRQPRADAIGPHQRLVPATANHQPRVRVGAVLPRQSRIKRDAAAITEQHRKTGRVQAPREPFHALARDGQKVMVLLLMQADLVVLELNMRGRVSWIEPVLVDAAVPGFGD